MLLMNRLLSFYLRKENTRFFNADCSRAQRPTTVKLILLYNVCYVPIPRVG